MCNIHYLEWTLSCKMSVWFLPVFSVLVLRLLCSNAQPNTTDVIVMDRPVWVDVGQPVEVPELPWPPIVPNPYPPNDVTTITLTNTSVGLCNAKHLCSHLGCEPTFRAADALCYCDQACVIYDDCCRDYASTCVGQVLPSSNASEVKIELENFSCVSPYKFRLETYLLVNACPNDSDSLTAVSCKAPGAEDALAAIPCYNKNSGVHFRNVYCARCHGQEMSDIVPWEVEVKCEWHQYEMARELLQRSIKNIRQIEQELGCAIKINAPVSDDVTKAPRECNPGVKGHCATQQDPLSDACASYTALTTVAGYEGLALFRNPHCALCNLPNEPDRMDSATYCGGHFPVFYLSGMFTSTYIWPDKSVIVMSGLSPPISILFDFRASSDVRIIQDGEVLVSETVQCPLNEVYDPFVSRCRRLSCPKGYLLREEQCVPDIQVLEHGCGDTGDDDIVIELTVNFDDCHFGDGLPEVGDAHRIEYIQFCLEDLLGFEQGTLQADASTPEPINPKGGHCSLFASTTSKSLNNFQEVQEISLPATPFCHVFDTNAMWSVELNQNCKNLPKDKCTGRWLNSTQFSLLVQNGTTLIYVNASASWYALNQAMLRASFQMREQSFELFTDVQICAEPSLACPLVVLNSSFFHPDENDPGKGSIIHNHTGRVFKSDEYIRTESGEIQVCSFFDTNGTRNGTSSTFLAFSEPQQILSLIGNIISMAATAVTFITYCAFKELRQRISLAIMSLVACLFLAQLLLLISGSATSNPQACATVAVLGHFFWLSTVLWTSVLAFDLNQTFAYSSKIRRLDSDKRIFLLHMAFSFGGAMLIVIPCLVVHLCGCTDLPLWYGNEIVCWIGNGYVNLVAFGVPIGLVVVVNGILFAFTVRGIRSTNKQSNPLKHTEKTELQQMRQELLVYIKISSLMGFTWVFGFVAALSNVVALWYIFIILNSCQGLLIFLSFICNKKVWRLWKNLLSAGKTHKGSSSYSTRSSTRPMLKHRCGSSSATRKTTVTEL